MNVNMNLVIFFAFFTLVSAGDKTCADINGAGGDNGVAFDCSVEAKIIKMYGVSAACEDAQGEKASCTAAGCCTRTPQPACLANVDGKVPFVDATKQFEYCTCGDRTVNKNSCTAGSSCIGNVCKCTPDAKGFCLSATQLPTGETVGVNYVQFGCFTNALVIEAGSADTKVTCLDNGDTKVEAFTNTDATCATAATAKDFSFTSTGGMGRAPGTTSGSGIYTANAIITANSAILGFVPEGPGAHYFTAKCKDDAVVATPSSAASVPAPSGAVVATPSSADAVVATPSPRSTLKNNANPLTIGFASVALFVAALFAAL